MIGDKNVDKLFIKNKKTILSVFKNQIFNWLSLW